MIDVRTFGATPGPVGSDDDLAANAHAINAAIVHANRLNGLGDGIVQVSGAGMIYHVNAEILCNASGIRFGDMAIYAHPGSYPTTGYVLSRTRGFGCVLQDLVIDCDPLGVGTNLGGLFHGRPSFERFERVTVRRWSGWNSVYGNENNGIWLAGLAVGGKSTITAIDCLAAQWVGNDPGTEDASMHTGYGWCVDYGGCNFYGCQALDGRAGLSVGPNASNVEWIGGGILNGVDKATKPDASAVEIHGQNVRLVEMTCSSGNIKVFDHSGLVDARIDGVTMQQTRSWDYTHAIEVITATPETDLSNFTVQPNFRLIGDLKPLKLTTVAGGSFAGYGDEAVAEINAHSGQLMFAHNLKVSGAPSVPAPPVEAVPDRGQVLRITESATFDASMLGTHVYADNRDEPITVWLPADAQVGDWFTFCEARRDDAFLYPMPGAWLNMVEHGLNPARNVMLTVRCIRNDTGENAQWMAG